MLSQGPTKYSYDAFISHNGSQKPWVRQIVKLLRDFGLNIFFDEDSIKPGENIVSAIEKALNNSKHVLLVLSPQAISSKWVALEWSSSIHKDPDADSRYIIPILREDCEIPLTLSRLKYLDARHENIDEILSQIVNAIGDSKQIELTLSTNNKKTFSDNSDSNSNILINEQGFRFFISRIVPPESKSYVIRSVDEELWSSVKEGSGLAIIWGPRKIGKSSMLHRIIFQAKKNRNKSNIC